MRGARPSLILLLALAGCGQQPAGPDPFASTPSLATGKANVKWTSASASGMTVVSLDNEFHLQVVIVEGNKFEIFAAQTKPHEWSEAEAVVEPVVDCTRRVGCDPDLPEEWFSAFAGDSGCSTRVEGCDAPEVERAREHLRAVVKRYLPDARL